MLIKLAELCRLMENLRDQFQREANQAILKRDFDQGHLALGGIDALDKLRTSITFDLNRTNQVLAVDIKQGQDSPAQIDARLQGKHRIRTVRSR